MWHHGPFACGGLTVLLSHKKWFQWRPRGGYGSVPNQRAATLLHSFPINKSSQRQMSENEII